MVFQIRRDDGSIEVHSSGMLINPNGSAKSLDLDEFTIKHQEFWRSPATGAEYPIQWELEIPNLNLNLSLSATVPNQELELSYTYWEGAVFVTGMYQGEEIHGVGYVELTGYAGSMEGEF
jgi:predicted secreted hydrolase